MDNVKEFLKNNWKTLLLILCMLMWFTKCTQSCNRKQTIKKCNIELASKDSLINFQDSIIHDLKIDTYYLNQNLKSEQKHNDNFSSIASENQTQLNKKITDLQKENNKLKKQVAELEERLKEEK